MIPLNPVNTIICSRFIEPRYRPRRISGFRARFTPRIGDLPCSRNTPHKAGSGRDFNTPKPGQVRNLKKTLSPDHRKMSLLYCNPTQFRRNADVDIKNIKNSAIGFNIWRHFSRPDGPGRCITIETGGLTACQYRWHAVRPAAQSQS
ncbi:hypothetical protein [Ralstonia solanacearum]|uniref:hypothetical protein n=1 Tax=Ralstonia solanacearum TaxID=305 RepID=UPI00168AB786|nr:hypothetical protein [Ralstonia solanacearum]QNT62830.1 hypothetical protein C2L97_24335 [Ralstonia solanacearum]QNT63422.1 hypothetical protein C2L97_27415 [Ralstonia solanacearum]